MDHVELYVAELFRSAAEAGPLDIVKLRKGDKILNISPHLPGNTPDDPYVLQVTTRLSREEAPLPPTPTRFSSLSFFPFFFFFANLLTRSLSFSRRLIFIIILHANSFRLAARSAFLLRNFPVFLSGEWVV